MCVASRDTPCSQPVSAASVPRRSVDYIFLIEYSQRTNATYLDYFKTALHSLVSALQGRAYGSADPNYAVVLYSLEQADPIALFVRPITNDFDLKDTVRHFLRNAEPAFETAHYSSREMDYLAVDKALQILSAVLRGDALTDTYSHSHTVFPRPFASVHMVVGLGLYEKRIDENSQTYSNAAITTRRGNIEKNMELILDHAQTAPNTALHFFFSRDIRSAVEFIGSSKHEVHYRDCTHLNKALTLKALLDAKSEASSLQAHMLALGRDIHVMDLSALTRTDCILAISPITWSSFDLQMEHMDKCSEKEDDYECYSVDSYCSPLHGCVREHSGTSDAQNSHPDDKVPLTDQLVMSHADLIKSAKNSEPPMKEDEYPMDELSILKMTDSSAPPFSLTDVVVGKPRTLKWNPDRDFAERLIKKGKPVVLKNSVVKTWAAMEKWNFSYLAHNMGTDTLQLVKCTDDFLTFDPDRTAPLKLKISLPFTETNMSTSSFFSCIQEWSSCSDGLHGHYYFGSVPEKLQPDLSPTRLLFRTSRDYEASKQFMWISSAGMITHAHFDQDFNFFVQLVGKKRFTLWPSTQHELMYVYPRVHPLWHKSRLNLRALDMTSFPNFAKSRALQVVVEPGDVLYVPPYTWHYVETLSPSVSLSTWSHDYDLYSHMNAIYRHDHKFDLLQDARGMYHATLPKSY